MLRQAGFVDAENDLGLARKSNPKEYYPKVCDEAKERYYELIRDNTRITLFRDFTEEYVMRQWSIGKQIKDISAALSDMNERSHRDTIGRIVKKYEVQWKIKRHTK
jgi:hypothetical protein